MRDEPLLFENALISSKISELITNETYKECVSFSLDEMIAFMKHLNYRDEDYNFHHIESIDQWKQDEDMQLSELYKQHHCEGLLDIFNIEHQGASMAESLKKIEAYGQYYGNAAGEFARVFMDELMVSSLLRSRSVSSELIEQFKGNINQDDLKTMIESPDKILTILCEVYPLQFSSIDAYEDSDLFNILIQQGFRNVLSKRLGEYRFSVIGNDGLIAYLYAKKSELYNLRMLLKAKNYYTSEAIQLSLLRRAYV